MRSGIRAVGPGQRLAARALGLEERQIMQWVVLPQALRIVIPPIGNQFNGMLKLSALVSVIGVQELLLTADQTASMNFRYLETLTVAGLYYLAMTTILMVIQFFIEQACQRRRGKAPKAAIFKLPSAADLGMVR
jgi:polar amino acid transport system permease protein